MHLEAGEAGDAVSREDGIFAAEKVVPSCENGQAGDAAPSDAEDASKQVMANSKWEGAGLKLKHGVGRKSKQRVGWYVEHGFDMSSGPGIRVDTLTSALLLGYPLDLAKQHAGLV